MFLFKFFVIPWYKIKVYHGTICPLKHPKGSQLLIMPGVQSEIVPVLFSRIAVWTKGDPRNDAVLVTWEGDKMIRGLY